MNNRTKTSAAKKAARAIALFLILLTVFSVIAVSASAYEVKGKTLSEVLGMDGSVYYQWLKAHEKDKYYLTTPYAHADHRNPNGDCQGANGSLDTPGVPAMNCMGFVWHILYMPTKMSGGKTGMIPAYGKGGWLGLYTNNRVTRRSFSSKKELLSSGYAEAGDIIWCFVTNENVPNDKNHICVYMGNGHSDKVWHSVGRGCVYGPIRTGYNQYVVLKSGVIPKLEAPTLKSVTNTAKGPLVKWKAVSGAFGYKVYVKNGSKWKELGATKKNYFYHKAAKSATKYTYTVRCVDRNIKTISGYNKKGISNTFYAAPGGFSAECAETGITFSWKPVDGAAKYRVYRRTAGKSWEVIAKTAATSIVDTKVKTSKKYAYTVRAVNKSDKNISAFRTPLVGYILTGVPRISDASVGKNGLTLTWNKVKGAEQYFVCKKVGASWKKIGVSKTTNFTYKTPDKNVESTYTVRCLSSTNNAATSDFDRTGYTVMYQTAPTMTKIDAMDNGLRLTWKAQKNAELYRVYKKNASDKWVKLADTAETTFTDETAAIGDTCTYTLRSASADGEKLYSYFNTKGWSMTFAATPKPTATATEKGIKVSWKSVKNAVSYRVFIKRDGSWHGVTTTKDNSYLFTDVNNGEEYTFTVRAMDASKWFNSFYKTEGVTATYVDPNAPEATEAQLADTGILADPETVTLTEAATEPQTFPATVPAATAEPTE